VTPDLYKPMYSAKVVAFFEKLMDQKFANKPFMRRHYLDYYFISSKSRQGHDAADGCK
jgi:hypothetical protein